MEFIKGAGIIGTDSMEADVRETEAVAVDEGEGDAKCLKECASGNLVEEPKTGVVDEDNVSNKVHKFYFVKVWPCNDQKQKLQIKKLERFIQKLDRERNSIQVPKWSRFLFGKQLGRLRSQTSDLDYAIRWSQGILNALEKAFNRSNSHKNSYKRGSSSPSHLNFHITPQLRVLHGSSTKLARERELLKQISTTRTPLPADAGIHCDSTHFKEMINGFIQWFYFYKRKQGDARYNYFLKEFKRLEKKMEKSIAAATQQGQILNSRNTIKEYITFITGLHVEIEKDQKEKAAEINQEETEMEKILEEMRLREPQLDALYYKKIEAKERLLNLKKRLGGADVVYDEYLSLISKASDLAGKKDVAALEQLSRVED